MWEKPNSFDVNANPDDIRELLTTIRDTDDLYEGDVICLDNIGYYLDYNKIYRIDDFMRSRIEAERKRQEQIERERQEELARQERLAEEQRKLEEQKKKKEEETTKSVKPKRNRGLH